MQNWDDLRTWCFLFYRWKRNKAHGTNYKNNETTTGTRIARTRKGSSGKDKDKDEDEDEDEGKDRDKDMNKDRHKDRDRSKGSIIL